MRSNQLKFTFVFIFFWISVHVHAQQNFVRGLIMERSGVSRISNVSVLNKRTGQKILSNGLGLFQIAAVTGDTLLFSKPGYSDLIHVLPSLSDVALKMQPVIELAEVRVTGQTKQEELQEYRDQYRKKGSYYAGKPPLLAYIFQPVTALYELLGKTPNQARRFNMFYIRELEQTEIDRRFNSYFIGKTTGLEGTDLKNFMILYRPGYEALIKMDEYSMINYVKRSLATFNNSGRPKGVLSLPVLPKAPDLTEKAIKY
ncbi:MAG: hypothetical protein ACYCZO_13020 [Daejeonella sp.]